MNKNSIIDTYSTEYFTDIVVANKYTTLEDLQNLYEYHNGDELDDSITSSDCCTALCTRKADNMPCVLIKHNHFAQIKSVDKKVDLINSICHESGHAALDIYEKIGQNICFCSPEPFCYLLGFIGECMYKTLTKKP